MTIHLPTHEFFTGLPTLARSWSAPLDSLSGGYTITVPADQGQGVIRATRLRPGLNLLEWQLQPSEDLIIKLPPAHHHPLRLLLCQRGTIIHTVDTNRFRYSLKEFYYSLSVCSGRVDQSFCVPGGEQLDLCLVEIDRNMLENRVPFQGGDGHQPLAPIFFDTPDPWPFIYRSSYCPTTNQVLRDLGQAERYDGLARQTFLESKTLELLTLTLQQYVDQQQPPDSLLPLSEADVQSLIEARRYILKHYVNPPSIRELTHIVGLNEFKLKRGYKQLFRTTVYEQAREEKFYRAGQLIAEGKWDIGTVAEKVGYRSKSHFAARFKERFGINPKEYELRLRNG